MKWIGRILLTLVILLVVVILGGWLYLRTSLPKTSGSVQLSGLDGPVEVVRDKDGVPHIFAGTDNDAFFALGYVHAQDRMWQLEFQRRIGAGRLSEILGEATLDTDKFLRTLGPYRAAETAWPALNPDVQAAFTAYTAGVNAWIDEEHTLPPEFLILGVKPEPWDVLDSVVWAKMMAWDLGDDYAMELLRARLTLALGPERAAEILPAYPEDGITILDDSEFSSEFSASAADGLLKMDTLLQEKFQLRGLDVGSNNWVIAGTRTDSGLPILANDMHLGARIPSIWYLAELQGDNLHITGVTFPGLPLVPSGHNENIAWALTNVGPDVQDLYIERINPANPNQYEVDGEWVDMEIVEELITVKGEDEPIHWAARSTRHGPLISDVSETATPLALRWVSLDPGDTTINAFSRVNYANNFEEFVDALEEYVAPSQNFIYADKEGNIGYQVPGKIPIRANPDHSGMFPVPGWNSEYEWAGWIPFDELPRAYNPEKGYIATANNKVVSDDYPYLISNTWAPPYREERISQLIEEMSSNGETISVDDIKLIHGDQASAETQDLLPYLLTMEPADERQAQALEILRAWDGVSSMDAAAPAIYQAWFTALGRALFEDDLRGDLYDEMASRTHSLFLAEIAANPEANGHWCDNVLTPAIESCADTTGEALDAALDDLTERMGENMEKWRWGDVHRTQYPHNPFSEVPLLKPIFHRSIENGGDGYTVDVAPARQTDLYNQYHVPSQRHIIDMSDLNNSLFIHTTGQSGNVLSKHYDDFIERHRNVEYLPMTWGRENVDGDVLTLEP
jgi:penicillin amidase